MAKKRQQQTLPAVGGQASTPRPPEPRSLARTPLLSLTTLTERRVIEIDGDIYELKSLQELSIFERERLRVRGARLQFLMEKNGSAEGLPDKDILETQELLAFLARAVLLAPAEVNDRLNDDQRLAIVQAFTRVGPATVPAGVATSAGQPEPTTKTGEK